MIRGAVRSPIQRQQPQDMVSMMSEFLRIAPQVLQARDDIKKFHDGIREAVGKIKQGPQGPAGLPGRPGQDAPAPDHNAIADLLVKKLRLPKDGKHGKDGRDGRSVDPDEIIDHIKKNKKLKVGDVDGLEQTLSVIRNFHASGGIRGGGDTVAAGTGVTIVQSNGVKTISASTSISRLTATGVVNGSNTAFTFVSKPSYIVSDGAWYIENTGWTWNAGTLTATMSAAPQTNIFGIA